MMDFGDGMGWGAWVVMGFAFLLFWGVVLGLAAWIVKTVRAEPDAERIANLEREVARLTAHDADDAERCIADPR